MHYHHCFTLKDAHEEALQKLLERFKVEGSSESARLRTLLMKLYLYVQEKEGSL